ncbi:MAG TPA: SH3 domain-containing C40 family peptidase [Candidatus Saccharimonadales bacterium]|nr:SH3 domain-containing C40 family peptidase [Candidatus Saccharimonadales bacterium]
MRPALFSKKFPWWAVAILLTLAGGCSTPVTDPTPAIRVALHAVQEQFAPDRHLTIFDVSVRREGDQFVLEGNVDNPAARQAAIAAAKQTGARVRDQITLLPARKLGDRVWGIATVSVLNVREKPGHISELGTQILSGDVFRILNAQTNWFLVQSSDHYVGWVEGGGFMAGNAGMVQQWNDSPRLIVTAFEERILEQPDAEAAPVSDVVMGGVVQRVGENDEWDKVRLADGRTGYLPKKSVADFEEWRTTRRATPANIERTARSFLGRPYFWGGNSIRGLDCSGLTKLSFFLNGVALPRNASEQCHEGVEVPLDDNYAHLKKGDLLFFGHRAIASTPEKIVHTGLYLGDKKFIQSAGMVRISSLDPTSPLRDEHRIKTLLHARRILP